MSKPIETTLDVLRRTAARSCENAKPVGLVVDSDGQVYVDMSDAKRAWRLRQVSKNGGGR